ncbi:MAG: DedA family protein [Planctomycetota bacterium]
MALLEVGDTLTNLFAEWNYLGPFLVLFLCGIGLPLPEEVTLIGSGILVYEGHAEFLPITVVCSVAILLGDSVPFWLGRHYGMDLLKRNRWLRRVISPRQIRRVQRSFDERGSWATFAFRFFAGVRIPGYFVSGALGMRYPRFVLLDSLGILISVPVSIFLGQWFGGRVDELKHRLADLHLLLAFLALSLLIILVVRSLRRPRGAQPDDGDLEASLPETVERPRVRAPIDPGDRASG